VAGFDGQVREVASGERRCSAFPESEKKEASEDLFDWALVGLGSGSMRGAWGCFPLH